MGDQAEMGIKYEDGSSGSGLWGMNWIELT